MEKRTRRSQEDEGMKRNFTIEEVQQLRNLNIELMEAVTHVAVHFIKYAEKNKIPLPDDSGLINLLAHARKVIEEINEEITFSQTHNYKSRKLPAFDFDDDNPDKLPESLFS
jgi:hypothetical protein